MITSWYKTVLYWSNIFLLQNVNKHQHRRLVQNVQRLKRKSCLLFTRMHQQIRTKWEWNSSGHQVMTVCLPKKYICWNNGIFNCRGSIYSYFWLSKYIHLYLGLGTMLLNFPKSRNILASCTIYNFIVESFRNWIQWKPCCLLPNLNICVMYLDSSKDLLGYKIQVKDIDHTSKTSYEKCFHVSRKKFQIHYKVC